MSSAQKKWFRSVFRTEDDSINFDEPVSPPQKKIRSNCDSSIKIVPAKQTEKERITADIKSGNWLEKFSPQTLDDLAVHSKKIEELQDWFNSYESKRTERQAPILLITGPSGSGKTAAIHCIARHMGYNVREWITPIDIELPTNFNDECEFAEKKSEVFYQFLIKSSRYPSLFDTFDKQLVLVEDFPNIFLKDPNEFDLVMERYKDFGKSPLVFIVSDTRSKKMNILYQVFKDALLIKYGIHQITFNSVSSTLLKKALKRICEIMSKSGSSAHYKPLSQDVLDSIILTSQGDVRNAVINFHFASQKNSSVLETELIPPSMSNADTSKKGQKGKSKKLKSVGCDETVTILHGVGRVLTPKYFEKSSENGYKTFFHKPEKIADDFLSQPSAFVDFVHTNYICHYSSIEDVIEAADVLSYSDLLSNEWRDENLVHLSFNMAIRGVMVYNRKPVLRWMPVRGKPKRLNSFNLEADLKRMNLLSSTSSKVLISDIKTYANIIQGRQS